MVLADVTLADKYELAEGRVYLTAIQALVRLPLEQVRRDRAAGHNTGGFISGYRGSPLGGYDEALWRSQRLLTAHNIHFQPGLNEEIAATSVWGSQQVGLFPGATVDGVFGIWYGKGPGVDRSMDALKHANLAGTAALGGALALAGDDHGCVSSTLPHQSEYELIGAMLPILVPATVQDYLELGLAGIALSRYSGCWVAIKATSETAEASASISVGHERPRIVMPTDFELPPGGLSIRWPDSPHEQERRLHGPKLEAVAAFARANGLDRILWDKGPARLGIMAPGKAWLDVRQALADLRIDEGEAARLGIRLMKVGLAWPLESAAARRFADGLADLLVVEEKRPLVEEQLARILYNLPADRRPTLAGKRDETGATLFPTHGEIGPVVVARAVVARLERLGADVTELRRRLALLESFERPAGALAAKQQRSAYFCSGCPHNTSTNVPEGSRAVAGIGCHTLAVYMNRRNDTFTQMGGEGAPWIGQAPFTTEKHVFQNLGDGTYSHSGLLAIRAAAAAGVNITYKILYNDAVAMTGGQPVEGGLTVAEIARQVAAEGARKIVVVTDEPDKYPLGTDFPPGDHISPSPRTRRRAARAARDAGPHGPDLRPDLRRREAPPAQTRHLSRSGRARLHQRRGVRGLRRLFAQLELHLGAAARNRIRPQADDRPVQLQQGLFLRRGLLPQLCHGPWRHAAQGRVRVRRRAPPISIRPRACPNRRSPIDAPTASWSPASAAPASSPSAHCSAWPRISKARAARCSTSPAFRRRTAPSSAMCALPRPADELATTHIGPGGATLLLACDMVVAASASSMSRLAPGTRAVVNTHLQPTAAFVQDSEVRQDGPAMLKSLRAAVGGKGMESVDASRLAFALMGDSIAANPIMLGFAWQKGMIPLGLASILRAIELNGVAVEANKRAFAWGRRAAHDLASVEARIAPRVVAAPPVAEQSLAALVERRVAFLTGYQNAAYAGRYRATVMRVAEAERARAGGEELALAVAQGLFKLMAYKDEYEVARLYTDGDFAAKLRERFDGDVRVEDSPRAAAVRAPRSRHRPSHQARLWAVGAVGVQAAGGVTRFARYGTGCVRLHQGATPGTAVDRRL